MTVTRTVTDGVARVMLDHPPLNILTRAELAVLRQAVAAAAADRGVRVLLLGATGKHFSAGADVAEHLPPTYRDMIPEFLDTVRRLTDFPLPVIAAVQGRCLGGGFELVQAADIVIAGAGASFGQPEIQLGVFPPVAAALLPRRVAPGVAARLVLTGDPITAAEAERAGLVVQVVPDGELTEAADGLARRIARHSAAALRLAKRALRTCASVPPDRALATAGALYVEELMAARDAVEGLRAFTEKRPPVWSHA